MAQAMSGVMSVTGHPGGPPVKAGVPVADIGCALFATYALLAAYIGREKSGGVTARSAAHNCELQVGIVCHEFFESLKLTLNRQQEWLFKRFGNPAQEARRIGSIDQPMIIRKR